IPQGPWRYKHITRPRGPLAAPNGTSHPDVSLLLTSGIAVLTLTGHASNRVRPSTVWHNRAARDPRARSRATGQQEDRWLRALWGTSPSRPRLGRRPARGRALRARR